MDPLILTGKFKIFLKFISGSFVKCSIPQINIYSFHNDTQYVKNLIQLIVPGFVSYPQLFVTHIYFSNLNICENNLYQSEKLGA